jgi:hypothetical protein
MIADFRTRIYCRETGYSIREIDQIDPLWIARIDEFFEKRAILPPRGDPNEYSAAFEAVYPTEQQRRQYIDDAIKKGKPSFAHRVLAALMTTKQAPCFFTTNFDHLLETSTTLASHLLDVNERCIPTIAALDSADRAIRCVTESDWPLIAKLHGDYQSFALKNTGAELERQDEKMREVLTGACSRFGLIVVGYSGRDASVMEALTDVLRNDRAYPYGLFWVVSSRQNLMPPVIRLLANAAVAGVDATIVEVPNFDELAAAVLAQVSIPPSLLEHVHEGRSAARLQPVVISKTEARRFPILRYSALRILEMPASARRISLESATTATAVRQLLKEHRCRAAVAALGKELAVFGKDDELISALASLGAKVAGRIELDPANDSWARGLIYDALTQALARGRPLQPRLKRAGHALVVAPGKPDESHDRVQRRAEQLAELTSAYQSKLTGLVPDLAVPYQEGVHIKLDEFEKRWWCGFEPFTFVDVPRPDSYQGHHADGGTSEDVATWRGDPAGDWRRERWAQKYNREWSKIIAAWARLLTSVDSAKLSAFNVPDGMGIDARFGVSPTTAWSQASHHHSYFDRTK